MQRTNFKVAIYNILATCEPGIPSCHKVYNIYTYIKKITNFLEKIAE
jgi:hypothetical protein